MTGRSEACAVVALTREIEAIAPVDLAQATHSKAPEPKARDTRAARGNRSGRASRPWSVESWTEVIPIQPMDGDQEHEVGESPVRPFVRFVVDGNLTSPRPGLVSPLALPIGGPKDPIPTAVDHAFAETFVRHPWCTPIDVLG